MLFLHKGSTLSVFRCHPFVNNETCYNFRLEPFHKRLPITYFFVRIKMSLTNLVFNLYEVSDANLNAHKEF